MNLKLILLITTIIVNAILWLSYLKDKLSYSDFGEIKSNTLRYYMLTIASLAYLSNLLFVIILISKKDISDLDYKIAIFSIFVYYILQLFFFPLVRHSIKTKNKMFVRLLLLICCIPMFALSLISLNYKYLILKVLSFFTLIHVFVNDAILYGFLF